MKGLENVFQTKETEKELHTAGLTNFNVQRTNPNIENFIKSFSWETLTKKY